MCLESIGVTMRGLTRPVGRIAFAFALCLLQAAAASAQLIISEFRLRGPSGANDEFIEIYNAEASITQLRRARARATASRPRTG